MKYKIKVKIQNPHPLKEMSSELLLVLNCNFTYDAEQYGNGYYVCIDGKEFYRQIIDLRYDKSFDSSNKKSWLEKWANSYWTGKNGAWSIKEINIIEIER